MSRSNRSSRSSTSTSARKTKAKANAKTATPATPAVGPAKFAPRGSQDGAITSEIIGRMRTALDGWWNVEDEGETVGLEPAVEEVRIHAVATEPIFPQLLQQLRRVVKFYTETIAFLESHADQIVGGKQATPAVPAADAAATADPQTSLAFELPIMATKQQAVIDYFNAKLAGVLELMPGRRTITGRLTCPDAEIMLSAVEPIRVQLFREFLRLSELYQHLADTIRDMDWCPAEDENTVWANDVLCGWDKARTIEYEREQKAQDDLYMSRFEKPRKARRSARKTSKAISGRKAG